MTTNEKYTIEIVLPGTFTGLDAIGVDGIFRFA